MSREIRLTKILHSTEKRPSGVHLTTAKTGGGVVVNDLSPDPDSPARRARIEAGDRLVSINGLAIANNAPPLVEALLSQPGPISIGLMRSEGHRHTNQRPITPAESNHHTVVVYAKAEEPLGIELAGGSPHSSVFIMTIDPSGPAANTLLLPGDVLLAIGTEPLPATLPLAAVRARIDKCKSVDDSVTLTVRSAVIGKSLPTPVGAVHRVLLRRDAGGCGLAVAQSKISGNAVPGLVVDHIAVGSVIEGKLLPGDIICGVDGTSISSMLPEIAAAFLHKRASENDSINGIVELVVRRQPTKPNVITDRCALVNSPEHRGPPQSSGISGVVYISGGRSNGTPLLLAAMIHRDIHGLGFTFAGGVESDHGRAVVTTVEPDGPAAGKILPGDEMLYANGQNLLDCTHSTAVDVIRCGSTPLRMVLHRPYVYRGGSCTGLRTKPHFFISHFMAFPGQCLGLTLAGGAQTSARGLYVVDIDRNSPAFGVGGIRRGDHLVCAGAFPLLGMGHKEAIKVLTALNGQVKLLIERTPRPVSLFSTGSKKIRILKCETGLGFVANASQNLDRTTRVTVEAVREGSEAAKKLQVHDEVVQIQGRDVHQIIPCEHALQLLADQKVGTFIDVVVQRTKQPAGVRRVVLFRKTEHGDFGFKFTSASSGAKIVVEVTKAGSAMGKLGVSDRIFSVNGIMACTLTHQGLNDELASKRECVIFLDQAHCPSSNRKRAIYHGQRQLSRNRSLSTNRNYHAYFFHHPNGDNVIQEYHDDFTSAAARLVGSTIPRANAESRILRGTAQLTRSNKSESFGFGLGTTDTNSKVVTIIVPNGQANGKIAVADEIIAVNGLDVQPLDHENVLNIIKKALVLDVIFLRDQALNKISVPVLLVRQSLEVGFGFQVEADSQGAKIVTAVTTGSTAEDRLTVGDVIIGINGLLAVSLSIDLLVKLISKSTDVMLEILPSSIFKAQESRRGSVSDVAPRLNIKFRDDEPAVSVVGGFVDHQVVDNLIHGEQRYIPVDHCANRTSGTEIIAPRKIKAPSTKTTEVLNQYDAQPHSLLPGPPTGDQDANDSNET